MRIKEILYLETDNSCAYCGIKQNANLTIHHLDGNRSNNAYDNQIVLCHNCHHRLNENKGISEGDIRERKKNLIRKTITQYGVNALKIAYRKEGKVIAIPFLLYHLVEMGYFTQKDSMMLSDGILALSYFEITKKGKELYQKWLM